MSVAGWYCDVNTVRFSMNSISYAFQFFVSHARRSSALIQSESDREIQNDSVCCCTRLAIRADNWFQAIFLQQTVWSDGGRSREAVHFNRQNRISTILNFIRYTHMCLRRWMPVGFLHIPTFKHSLVVIVYHPFNVQFEMNWFEMRKLLALVKTWFQSKHCEQMKWTNFQLNGANT